MSATIRPARAGDGPALFAIWEALRQYNASIDERIIPAAVSEREFLAGLDEVLGRDRSVAFVAEAESGCVGFVTGSIEENQPDRLPPLHATIGYLFVAATHRRQGIARSLFAAVAAWATKRADVSHFEMPVLAADEEATHFWRAIGFSPFIVRLWAPLSALDRES